MLAVRLEPELEQRLTVLAKKTRRSKSYLAKEALREYLDRLDIQAQRRDETLKRWEAYEQTGKTIAHDAMAEWLKSWGEDGERECPATKY